MKKTILQALLIAGAAISFSSCDKLDQYNETDVEYKQEFTETIPGFPSDTTMYFMTKEVKFDVDAEIKKATGSDKVGLDDVTKITLKKVVLTLQDGNEQDNLRNMRRIYGSIYQLYDTAMFLVPKDAIEGKSSLPEYINSYSPAGVRYPIGKPALYEMEMVPAVTGGSYTSILKDATDKDIKKYFTSTSITGKMSFESDIKTNKSLTVKAVATYVIRVKVNL